ncbi:MULTISPECIES: lactoylglutathione lyase family protein [unclassified Halomonas]|uniref:Lactoylglutathione lyase family protein n=1 Tax=Halomonas sp. RT37 TaxID=2950872 RepID=A0AAU7KKH9_9GAMM|nr:MULTISPECIES: lactoylglutathione lyase family protein [unclassified Halomonas]MBR9770885.1 lactoylglutathione lyase family protein [Gammaproteobacteria bacterium]MBS8268460.1 lactoylglutathione lyase family protein [Halomonas litopenaei]USZ50450.1 lactoylglutathione lyase family protein [Halomonas sp. DN3]
MSQQDALANANHDAPANSSSNSPNSYPRSFSHIGISVPDVEAAVAFYTQVLGWYQIMAPTTIEEDDSAIGEMCTDVFGPGWGSFRIAHLSTGDRVGVELFEFANHEDPENNFEYWKTGVFHFCVQDPDVEGLAERIVAAGGKKRMPKVREYYPGEKPYRMIYMEDPFGNILEIYSHSYELTYSAGAYQD